MSLNHQPARKFRPRWPWWRRVVLSVVAGCTFAVHAAVLEHKGRIWVGDRPFEGAGQFSFVILDETGEPLWTSGALPTAGQTNALADAISLPVTNGHYEVRLGDRSRGQPMLNETEILATPGARLRVWFNDGRQGWHRAGTDTVLDEALREHRVDFLTGEQAEAILRGVRTLRRRLEHEDAALAAARARGAGEFPAAVVAVGNGPALGRTNAPLVLVEFVDYECLFSRRFHEQVRPGLMRDYVQTGRLRWVTRHLPMPFHSQAHPAVGAALCAREQDRFWEMRDQLFAGNRALSRSNFLTSAALIGLETNRFARCLDVLVTDDWLEADAQAAREAGVKGTPAVVIGRLEGGFVKGRMVAGAQAAAVYEAVIAAALAEQP